MGFPGSSTPYPGKGTGDGPTGRLGLDCWEVKEDMEVDMAIDWRTA